MKTQSSRGRSLPRRNWLASATQLMVVPRRAVSLAVLATLAHPAGAMELQADNPDLKVVWDTTLKYSTAYRLSSPSNAIVGGGNYNPSSANYFPNTDDGDRNFKKGLISNRVDVLSEMDVSYKNLGFRISGAGWRDSVYERGANANDAASTANPTSVSSNQFTAATRDLMGQRVELLDAFVFGKFDFNGKPTTLRAGKHTVLYGESLMMGANGIAAAQAPIDVIKAMAVPNAQFKEFMMPVNQLSGQIQLAPSVMLGGYYMLEWKGDRLPASGSYFSGMDSVGTGGESLIVGSTGSSNLYFGREADMKAKKPQGGLQFRFHSGEVDYGLYAVQWNDHGPSGLYLHPTATTAATLNGVRIGSYQWAFHEGIRALGGSFSTTLGSVNLAGETSVRYNTPLNSDAGVDMAGANNSDNPLYAVGKSAHANLNWIASLAPNFLARETDLVGEIGWNRRLSVSKNAAAMNPNATRDATNVRLVFEPKYRQVISGLDLSVPIGLGYGLAGNSSVVGAFSGRHTGDFSVGINGSYLDVWRFGLNLTTYLGTAGPFIENGHQSFKQHLSDRTYVSFNLRRTF